MSSRTRTGRGGRYERQKIWSKGTLKMLDNRQSRGTDLGAGSSPGEKVKGALLYEKGWMAVSGDDEGHAAQQWVHGWRQQDVGKEKLTE